jgi:hypothetical protein
LIASGNTKAGRLLAAKDSREHLTLVLPIGAMFQISSRCEWQCTVAHRDAQVAKFYDIAKRRDLDFPLEFLLLSWDTNRNRPLVEYTRMVGR